MKVNMQENVPPRRTFLIIFLLSFLPYFLPENSKPEIYRYKTDEELEAMRRDRFIGGKIENVPFQ